MGVNITRRDWCIGAGALAGCFVLGGVGVAFASEEDFLRPPGGQDEGRLSALCMKCDRCRTVCPQSIIVPVSVEESVRGARTPKLDFHRGFCDFCGLCQEVCPTQALAPRFDPADQALGIAVLDATICLAYVNVCEKCKEACPYDALEFDELDRPSVVAERCNGCGRCVDACHVNVAGSFTGHERALEVRTVAASSEEGLR
ncbi:4Fe-4S dicluster domain-containing protein [Adlercreutzia equolifaciens]|uniref:4Fe-4S dicluster domain-containing protein n=1 Tax=Adlercreutzia equolifaciens TaxID=446660 RepID=UPI0023AED718|nr:4Fe-4S dicluster domain-containing protein [Adlercreutzia equolifaciens]MDE8702115.1 4Fe-4S dicluster domain-containing protein [Adlercreutzia equolifaciens]